MLSIPDVDSGSEERSGGEDDEDSDTEGDGSSDESGEERDEAEPVASTSQSTARKAPAWTDPDDTGLSVALAENKRLRKLRDAPSENVVGGREYERRLRRQFERINPTPEWASKARKKLLPSKQKRRRSSVSSASEATEGDEDMEDLLTSTGGVLGQRPKTLAPGSLTIERLRDANLAAPTEGAVKIVQFHPSNQVPVLLTAGEDRRLRLFNVSLLPFPLCQRSQ